jgi:hypothetical protein
VTSFHLELPQYGMELSEAMSGVRASRDFPIVREFGTRKPITENHTTVQARSTKT